MKLLLAVFIFEKICVFIFLANTEGFDNTWFWTKIYRRKRGFFNLKVTLCDLWGCTSLYKIFAFLMLAFTESLIKSVYN